MRKNNTVRERLVVTDELLEKIKKQNSKEEARASLIRLGIIDEDGNITDDFKGIVVKKKRRSGTK